MPIGWGHDYFIDLRAICNTNCNFRYQKTGRMKRIFLLGAFILTGGLANAQIGNLLKKEAVKFIKTDGADVLTKQLEKTKEKFDSASFSYAISLHDKAAQFESKEKLSNVVTVSNMFIKKNKDKSDLEQAKEYMDFGEMAYAANGYKIAEGYFISANAILMLDGMTNTALYARGMANLGLLYNSMGRYSASEVLTREALQVREKIFGKDSKDYAASLNNLAVLNKDLGNYNDAEREISEAIEINKSVLGEESIAYAISLNNRGVLLQTLGRYADAEKDMNLALTAASATLKPFSLQFTRLQSNLAILYQQVNRIDEAEALYKKAISAIARNPAKSKKTNPDYAHMIENLASLYANTGNYEAAEKLYLEALAIYERKFNSSYSGYGLASARLGAMYLAQKNFTAADKYLAIAESVMSSTFGDNHPYTVDVRVQRGILNWQTDNRKKAEEYLSDALDRSLEFVGKYFAPMSDAEKTMYWKTLKPRFETYFAFAAESDNPFILKKAARYRLATKAMLLSGTTRVKSKILNSGDEDLIKDYQTWLDQKGMLAHYYAMSEEDLREQKVNLDSINQAANRLEKSLSERSGLFTSAYRSEVPTVDEVQRSLKPDERAVEIIRIAETVFNPLSYLALVISPDHIDAVSLENGAALEGKQYKYYRNLIKFKKEDRQSYAQYWQPIDNKLADARRVYLSLDGVYNQVSINSLQAAPGKYAIDNRSYLVISSLRDLASSDNDGTMHQQSALLIGNPTYGSSSVSPLPGTGQEVSAIQSLLQASGFKVAVRMGAQATENAVKKESSRGVIHIATHGFFVADPKNQSTSVFSIPLYNIQENVLLRSGLLLAGAGNQEGAISGAENNGVLTSYEVMNLSLDQADLVVLSACETGLGDIMSGEGVFGLQRAFMIAGAKSVIMSLWKVDDAATQLLMVNFYKNWIASGDMEKSFIRAQKEVRKSFSHPYYWGSFILLHD